MIEEQKITIYWETKVEHKEVIYGTKEEINSVIEVLGSDSSDLNEYLEDLECSIKTHQTSESELTSYEVKDIES